MLFYLGWLFYPAFFNIPPYILLLFFSGYCRETNVRASIEIVGTQQVIFDVDSKDLVPLEEFTVDVAVCLGIKYVVTDQIPEISQKLG